MCYDNACYVMHVYDMPCSIGFALLVLSLRLGAEGQRVFRTFAESTRYKDAVKHLEEHFAALQSALLRYVSQPVSLSPNTLLICEQV